MIGLANAAALRPGDTLYRDVPVQYPPIPSFSPEHFAVARGTDPSKHKQFRRGIEQLEEFGARLGFPDMFERVFGVHEYAPGEPFRAADHEVVATRVPHYRMEAYALHVSDGTRTLA